MKWNRPLTKWAAYQCRGGGDMDNRILDLIAAYEDELDIPEEKRTTRYSKQWKTFMLKDENYLDKARTIRDDVLTLMGCTLDDFTGDERYADSEFVKASVQNVVRPIRIASKEFEVVEIFGKPVLFTNERLRSMDIPGGLFRYDIRHGDDGNMVQLKNYVMVNHSATVICKEAFDMTQESNGNVFTVAEGLNMTEDDYNFTGERMTIEEYKNSYDELLQECNPEMEQTADSMGGMSMG